MTDETVGKSADAIEASTTDAGKATSQFTDYANGPITLSEVAALNMVPTVSFTPATDIAPEPPSWETLVSAASTFVDIASEAETVVTDVEKVVEVEHKIAETVEPIVSKISVETKDISQAVRSELDVLMAELHQKTEATKLLAAGAFIMSLIGIISLIFNR